MPAEKSNLNETLMDQQRLQADVRLIQELLTCPHGEEWILLKRHENLVDADFVQVMEQVAAQLFREGDRRAAKFLHNWAAQLHHILIKDVDAPKPNADQTQAYLQLIQALIDCPQGEESELLSRHSDLIGPGLVAMMHQVAQKMAHEGIDETAQFLENLANQINQSWIQAHVSPQRSPIQEKTQNDRQQEDSSEVCQSPSVERQGAESIPDPWGSEKPLSSALQLKVPQQIANGLNDVALLLHQIDKAIAAQTQVLNILADHVNRPSDSTAIAADQQNNPLWYMDVLERACDSHWILTTEEIERLLGIKPKCSADKTSYQRGCWTFEKIGKLGTQTAWRVHKVELES